MQIPKLSRALVAKGLNLLILFILGTASVYIITLSFPQPFFKYSSTRGTITVRSDREFNLQKMDQILSGVESKLKKSPLYKSETQHLVIIIQTPWIWNYFAAQAPQVGGINYTYFNHAIYLRQGDVDNNRLIGPSGNPVPGERTLEYFITHEITHTLEYQSMPLGQYPVSTNWMLEGYADYIAHDSKTYEQALDKYLNTPETTGAKYYTRVRTMTAYLLEKEQISFDKLWTYANKYDQVIAKAIPNDKPAIDDTVKF
ncbi:MAG: hypothetical protein OHK0017_05500 [Patescibacteria group bacterium]